MSEARKKLTIPDLPGKKASGERLVMVAVGEVLSAAWAEPVSYTHLTLPTTSRV